MMMNADNSFQQASKAVPRSSPEDVKGTYRVVTLEEITAKGFKVEPDIDEDYIPEADPDGDFSDRGDDEAEEDEYDADGSQLPHSRGQVQGEKIRLPAVLIGLGLLPMDL